MVILGFTHPVSLNNAACILIDGKVLYLVEEERLNRIKHSPHIPARNTISYCLYKAGINFNDIDYIAIGWDKIY